MERKFGGLDISIAVRATTDCGPSWNFKGGVGVFDRIYNVIEGEGRIYHHGRLYVMKPGWMHLIPSGVRCDMECPARMLKRWTHFKVALPSGQGLFQAIEPAFELKISDCSAWTPLLLDRFWELQNSVSLVDVLESEAALRMLISLFLRKGPGVSEFDAKMETASRFKKAFDLIESSLARRVSLDDLAEAVSLHPSYFSNEFARRMGVPPMEYLRLRRVELAKRLLLDSGRKLEDIASETGFADAFHLSRTFKRIVGLSPSEYRKKSIAI
jgi:AraC-like DNA-binding protein